MKHDLTERHLARSRNKGFTLVELMIAIGIIGVGMSLIAASFPAGMSSFRVATQLSRGSAVCRNALSLTIADGKNTASRIKNYQFTPSAAYSYGHPTSPLDPNEDTNTANGCIVIGRKYSVGPTNVDSGLYQLIAIAVSYDVKGNSNNGPSATLKTVTIAEAPGIGGVGGLAYTKVKFSSLTAGIPIGSPIVNVKTGAIAMIKSYDPDKKEVYLDRKFEIKQNESALVVMGLTGSDETSISPAFYVTSTLTGLK